MAATSDSRRVVIVGGGFAGLFAARRHFGGFGGWVVWLFIDIGFLTGFRIRLGAILSWWPAFVRDIRRERTFTIDDMPLPSGAYGDTRTATKASRTIRPIPPCEAHADVNARGRDTSEHFSADCRLRVVVELRAELPGRARRGRRVAVLAPA